MFGWYDRWQHRRNVEKMWTEVLVWITEHQARLSGDNRFLCNPTVLKMAFPEFDDKVRADVWARLKEKQIVGLDNFGEMVIR